MTNGLSSLRLMSSQSESGNPSLLRVPAANCFGVKLFGLLDWFSNACQKTKTKVITTASHDGSKQGNEPIKIHDSYA